MDFSELIHSDARRLPARVRLVEIYSNPVPAIPSSEADGAGGACASTANALGGARGALMALGLEAFAVAAVLWVYGMFHP